MRNLGEQLQRLAEEAGADFFGVADLSPARQAILDQGGALAAQYPRAVSLGLTLPHAIVDQLPHRNSACVQKSYRHHSYDVINQRLDHLASRLGAVIQRRGFSSLPVPASLTLDHERLMGLFSNKMAAHLAGLGWIGKSCLLVTPEAGPRVRWAAVLTSALLEPTGSPMASRCGDCDECVRICPPHAFTGRAYRDDEHRDVRFDVHKCQAYFDDLGREMEVAVCGLCLHICPYGRRAAARLGLGPPA